MITPQSRPQRRPGTRVIRWAQTLCAPTTLDLIVSPIVADLQHEDDQPVGSIARFAFRLRNYVGLFKAVCVYVLAGREGQVAVSKSSDPLRWLVTVLFAPLVALAAQALVVRLAWMALGGLSRDPAWTDWTVWAAKGATCPFMGAAFVASAWWTAPARKSAASTIALVVVAGWGSLLVAGTFYGMADGILNWWLSVMGLSGIGGGALTWWLVRRLPERGEAAG